MKRLLSVFTVPLLLAGAAAALPCRAQSDTARGNAGGDAPPPINLDAPATLAPGTTLFRLEARAFGGEEDLVYAGLSLRYGLRGGVEAILRGAFAGRDHLALPSGGGAIRHGGTDVELAAKYGVPGLPNVALLIGASFPVTPAQNDVYLTLGVAATARLGANGALYLNPRAVFVDHNTIAGIGLGARLRLAPAISLAGDYTPVVSGDNTRDETTGARRRRDVYGVGVRYAVAKNARLEIEAGYTNATGPTTGFALTPGLGNSGAFFVSLTSRR